MYFKYSIQWGVYKIFEKDHRCEMYHYKKIDDTVNWVDVWFPSCNVDIDTLQENNKGMIPVNVYALDEEEGKESVIIYRNTEVPKASHHINLIKFQDGDDYHYVSRNTTTNF